MKLDLKSHWQTQHYNYIFADECACLSWGNYEYDKKCYT